MPGARSAARRQRDVFHPQPPRAGYFGFDPPPLTIVQEAAALVVGGYTVSPQVQLTFYDFGALSIGYAIDFTGTLESVRDLSIATARSDVLKTDSRRRAEEFSAFSAMPEPSGSGLAGRGLFDF